VALPEGKSRVPQGWSSNDDQREVDRGLHAGKEYLVGEQVAVPIQELIEMLGLPADATYEQIIAAMDEVSAQGEALKAERGLEAEDVRIVAAAIRDAKIPIDRHEFWLNALKRDRASNRALIASLGAGIPTEATSRAARALLATRSSRASASPAPADADQRPVRIVTGKDPQTWTAQDHDDAILAKLKTPGVKPPGTVSWYTPSPNQPTLVENGDGTGYWTNPGQQEREASMRAQSLRDQALRDQQKERDKQARAALLENKRKWEW
jgi:hypothetical protein